MQNLDSVAQNMAELLHNYIFVPTNYAKFILRNLSGQSIRTSMRNLESVAQKMSEFSTRHERGRTDIYLLSSTIYIQAIIQSKLGVREFASFDDYGVSMRRIKIKFSLI